MSFEYFGKCCPPGYHQPDLDFLIHQLKTALDEWDAVSKEWSETKEYLENWFSTADDKIKQAVQDMLDSGELEEWTEKLIEAQAGLGSLHTEFSVGGCKVLMLGDSIANGYGWWTTDKTDENDGLCAIWREKYPLNTYDNKAVNRTALCSQFEGLPTISAQLAGVTASDYTHVFMICGINDISNLTGDNAEYFGFHDSYWYNKQVIDDYSTVTKAICSAFSAIHAKCPNAKVYYIIPPTTSYNVEIFQNLFRYLASYAYNYGAYVIDGQCLYFNNAMSFQKKYLHDRVHPNEAGYRLLEKLVIQTSFQQNQIPSFDTKIIYLPDIGISKSAPNKIVDVVVKYCEAIVPMFLLTYDAGNYFVIFNSNKYANLYISKSYENEVYLEFLFHSYNGLKICVEWNKATNGAIPIRVEQSNSNYGISGSVSSFDELIGDCHFRINNNILPSELGFNANPYVSVDYFASYTEINNVFYKQARAILQQPGSNLMVVYQETHYDESTVSKRWLKFTGTPVTVS